MSENHMAPDGNLAFDTDVVSNHTLTGTDGLHSRAMWIVMRKRHASKMSFARTNLLESEEQSVPPGWVSRSVPRSKL